MQLLVLWAEALQENAGDPCMDLFASFIPYFPPHKTPMGLPLNTPSSSAAPGNHQSSLGERYGVYAQASGSKGGVASWGVVSNHHAHLPHSSSAILLGSSATPPSKGEWAVIHSSLTHSQHACVLQRLCVRMCLLPWCPAPPPHLRLQGAVRTRSS